MTAARNGKDALISDQIRFIQRYSVHEQLNAIGPDLVSRTFTQTKAVIINLFMIRLSRRLTVMLMKRRSRPESRRTPGFSNHQIRAGILRADQGSNVPSPN